MACAVLASGGSAKDAAERADKVLAAMKSRFGEKDADDE